MSHAVLHAAGLILLAGGLVVYLGGLVIAFRRVAQQYSSAMAGVRGLRTAATVAAAGKLWPLLVVIIAGGGLLVLAR